MPNVFQHITLPLRICCTPRAAHPTPCRSPKTMPLTSCFLFPLLTMQFGPVKVPAYLQGSFQMPSSPRSLPDFSHSPLSSSGFARRLLMAAQHDPRGRELDGAPTPPHNPHLQGSSRAGTPGSSSSQLLTQTQRQNLGPSSPTASFHR